MNNIQNNIADLITECQNVDINETIVKTIFQSLDLTNLDLDDDETVIIDLCRQVTSPLGNVAAVCVYPQFITCVKNQFLQNELDINIATVVNFPSGNDDPDTVFNSIPKAIKNQLMETTASAIVPIIKLNFSKNILDFIINLNCI